MSITSLRALGSCAAVVLAASGPLPLDAQQAASRASDAPRAAPIVYEIAFPNAAHHEAEVSVTFTRLAPRPLEVRMSRSSPGRYALHEFAKNVYNFRATDSRGRALAVSRPNAHQWDVRGHDGTVRVTYTLFGDRADGTYTGIDRGMAHLNMPATFAWARGLASRPVRVTFRLPDPSWTVATQLFPTADSTTFTAPHLQYFLDSPAHLGRQSWHSWPVSWGDGPLYTMRIALHHRGTREEEDRYVDATQRIVEETARVFDGYPAFDGGTYTFLATYLPWAAGDGMEHRNSTSLTSSASLATAMTRLLGTVAHEFVHAWNVERIRPRSLEPFSFEEANLSGELWLAEGFTSYYAPLVMRRARLTTDGEFGASMAGAVNLVLNAPGRRYFSAVEMSLQAPFTDAAVSIDPQNKGNTFISYYPFGQAIALALDLSLRRRGRTLDDVMREMWRVHGAQRNHAPVRPYTMADVRGALARVAGDTTFARDFFARYIEGREAAPYADLLRDGGFLVRPARAGAAWAGALSLRFEDGGAVVTAPTTVGTPFHEAGLDRLDAVVALDGRTLGSASDLAAILAERRAGDRIPLVFESRGTRIDTTLILVEDPRIEIVPFEAAGVAVTDAVRAVRASWLGAR